MSPDRLKVLGIRAGSILINFSVAAASQTTETPLMHAVNAFDVAFGLGAKGFAGLRVMHAMALEGWHEEVPAKEEEGDEEGVEKPRIQASHWRPALLRMI